jgi:hypothetical protein
MDILEDRTLLSTYVVDSLTDTGTGSRLSGDLRYCLTKATSGHDTITFAPALQGTIYVKSTLPALNASVAVQGPGDNPGGLGSRLNVDNAQFVVGNTATVAISGLGMYSTSVINTTGGTLTVSGCNIGGGSLDNGGMATVSECFFGGAGINNYGTMTIGNCLFEGAWGSPSTITNSGMLSLNDSILSGSAPAVSNQGTMDIDNCTLTGNFGAIGAGISMSAGTLTINSSALAGNIATSALYIGGGAVSIDNSTFADNQGSDIYNAAGGGALQMYDTILADDLNGRVTSLGYNLIGNATGGNGFVASDLLNVNPLLGPLQNNGGAAAGVSRAQHVLQTMALLSGSPAIDSGDNTNAPDWDQRGPGYPRIVNGTIDRGAFEVQNTGPGDGRSVPVSAATAAPVPVRVPIPVQVPEWQQQAPATPAPADALVEMKRPAAVSAYAAPPRAAVDDPGAELVGWDWL